MVSTAGNEGVEAYYDASTRRFLAVGGSGDALAIHRPLWGTGVDDRRQAAAHVNDLIAQAAEAASGQAPARICDLGCGVGGTLFHLARRWPQAMLGGITISAQQVRLGQAHAQKRGLAERCRFLHADFTAPPALPAADLVVAVESHVHAQSADAFLRAAANHLKPGGILVVVDDMLACEEAALTPRETGLVARFRQGWRLGHVTSGDRLVSLARQIGYETVARHDLTGLLRLYRLRDLALRAAGPMAARLGLHRMPLFGNMIGGNALTESYRAGIMAYTMVVLRAGDLPGWAGGATEASEAVA